ncbi:hypothetical protein BSKO_07129 [Bryopsis sp. KO-2023]|nr:hypothetical protein BSKO_07129 [Bryopsis sp. KO-2023]
MGPCRNLMVSASDFACAGFSRDTRQSLNAAMNEMQFKFCNRQEIAMFLGQVKHEGGSDPTRQTEFCALNGSCDLNAYNVCPWNPSVQPAPGQHYRGRGPIQLSWSCNYKAAGDALGVDLLSNPNKILMDDKLSWKTALWYWDLDIAGASSHTVAWRDLNFGATTRKINGALECDNGPSSRSQLSRARNYRSIAKCMGLAPVKTNLFCSPGLTLEEDREGCPRVHTVESGDICYNIWRSNGLTEKQFRDLNPGINCNALQIGQRLCVGGAAPDWSKGVRQRRRERDTLTPTDTTPAAAADTATAASSELSILYQIPQCRFG